MATPMEFAAVDFARSPGPGQTLSWIRKSFTFADLDGATSAQTVSIGTLPVGAMIVDVLGVVSTTINAGTTTTVLLIGDTNDADRYSTSGTLIKTAGGYRGAVATGLGYVVTAGAVLPLLTSTLDPVPTAGAGQITILYIDPAHQSGENNIS